MEKIYKCKCCGKEFQNRDMLLETQEGVFFCQECVAKIAENFQNSETNNVLENEIPDAVKRLIENAEKNGNIKIEKSTTYKFIFGNDLEEIADEEEIPDNTGNNMTNVLIKLEDEMRKAADELRFEDAAKIRDKIKRLKDKI